QLAAVQRMTPQAEGKLGRMGKLWSLPDAAVDVVEYLCELTYRGLERGAFGNGAAACRGQRTVERLQERRVLLHDVRALVAVCVGDLRQQLEKAGHAVARVLREVGAAEKRRAVRREEHGERPAAAALSEHRVRQLIYLVEIRPLLAIDLDVDEMTVHLSGHFGVL